MTNYNCLKALANRATLQTHSYVNRSWHTSITVRLPLKIIHVPRIDGHNSSDGDAGTSSNRSASISSSNISSSSKQNRTLRMLEQSVHVGAMVHAGDVVAVLLASEKNLITPIYAPETGRIESFRVNVGDTLQTGDAIFQLETDCETIGTVDTVKNTNAKSIEPLESLVHDEQALDDYIQQQLECSTESDVLRLRSIAAILRDQHPQHRSKALRVYQQILKLQQNVSIDNSNLGKLISLAQTYTDVAKCLHGLGDLDAAVSYSQQGLTLREHVAGNTDAEELIVHIQYIGAMYRQKGDIEACIVQYERALQLQKKHYGDEHQLVGTSLNDLGALAFEQGKFIQALNYYRQALQIHQKWNVDDHADTAGYYQSISVALKYTGDYSGAIEHSRKALAVRQTVLGADHVDTAASHSSLGTIFAEMGEKDGALEQYTAARAIQIKHFGETHATTASTVINIGAVHYQHKNFHEALQNYRLGLDVLEKELGKEHPDVAAAYNNMGLTLYQMNQMEEALKHHRRAHDVLVALYGTRNHPTLAATIGSIGNVLKRSNKLEEALAHYKRAHQMLEEEIGANHPDIASSYNNMGQVLAMQGKLDEALSFYRAALRMFGETLGPQHEHNASCHFNCGLVLREKPSEVEAAIKEFELAQEIWMECLGEDHPHTKAAQQFLQQYQQERGN